MAIIYDPQKLLKRMAPRTKVRKLVTQNVTLNKAAVRSLSNTGILEKKTIEDIALKVIKQYKAKRADLIDAGATKASATESAVNGKALMVQRVRNAAVHEVTSRLKDKYNGEFYVWLPSTANIPDELHILNYYKTFQLGVGDDNGQDPGDRFGCQCGMKILVKEDTISL